MTLADLCGRYLRAATVLVGSFFCALLILDLFEEQIARTLNGEPFTLLGIEPVNVQGKPGEFITFNVVASRNRVCPAMIYGYWRAGDDPTHAFHRARIAGGYTAVSERMVNPITIPIPLNAPPGSVTYDWLMESICEDGVWILSSRETIGDLQITVLPN